MEQAIDDLQKYIDKAVKSGVYNIAEVNNIIRNIVIIRNSLEPVKDETPKKSKSN